VPVKNLQQLFKAHYLPEVSLLKGLGSTDDIFFVRLATSKPTSWGHPFGVDLPLSDFPWVSPTVIQVTLLQSGKMLRSSYPSVTVGETHGKDGSQNNNPEGVTQRFKFLSF
jgi:hypothetical protein